MEDGNDRAVQRMVAEQVRKKKESQQRHKNPTSATRQWSGMIPIVHQPSHVGKPENVLRGDDVQIQSQASRHNTHPFGKEPVLKGRRV